MDGNGTSSFVSSITQQYSNVTIMSTAFAAILAMALYSVPARIGKLDEDEPPILKSNIPLIGHLVGMLTRQVGYFQMLSARVPTYPAFTLRIFSNRIYVICDPSLIQAAYKNTKAFDFGQFVVESSQRAFEIGEQGMKIIRGETAPGYDPKGAFLNGNNGDSFLNDNHRLFVEALTPGAGLSDLNRNVVERVAEFLNGINGNGGSFRLYTWIRDALTLATANALYGNKSPLNKDHSLIDHLWEFEENMTLLMLGIFPTLIAPKAYYGRAAIKAAFTKYYAEKHDMEASALIKDRLASCRRWGFSEEDIANFEISTLFLATTNTVPTSFWQLSYILADPDVHRRIRKEVESIVQRKKGQYGEDEAVMDVTLFQTHCPLLLSTFHETLRLVDAATSVRAVIQPTTLTSSKGQSYNLKSPSVIQLPSGITHNSSTLWGSDVETFNPERFMPITKAKLDKETRKAQNQGYYPFGGGKHLCPGRHFAMMEILAFVAAIVVGFEIEGLKSVPERAFQKLGTAVRKPVGDVRVRIERREGWEGVRWRFDVEGEKGRKVDFRALGTVNVEE